MSATQRQIYDYIEDKYLGSEEFNYVEDSGSIAHKLKQAKLIRLMQCATNPGLLNSAITEYVDDFGGFENLGIDDKEIMTLVRESASMSVPPPKFVKIKELVEEIVKNIGPKGKVIIWSIFVKNILDLKDYLHGFGINSEVLYGDVPTVKGETNSDNVSTRSEIIDEFHNPESDFKVIIANPFAVGESISLHKACHNAIYMDKNFNASMYIQSKDRIHRYGLDKDKDVIDYYYFVSEDSIDLKIHDILIEKEEKMLEVIESEDIPLISLNMEESSDVNESVIKRIIKDYHARKSTRK
jgi:SNF2 family DNA or RNA helicase